MGQDNGEYEETRVRVYKKTKHKDEGTFQKYVVSPVTKIVGGGSKSSKEKRLTA